MMRRTFTENARVRMAFAGITAFYHALEQGKAGRTVNPFFFVSSSPWNLYDLLADFFAFNTYPKAHSCCANWASVKRSFSRKNTMYTSWPTCEKS
jgi:phosphatidate phosphatase APP1